MNNNNENQNFNMGMNNEMNQNGMNSIPNPVAPGIPPQPMPQPSGMVPPVENTPNMEALSQTVTMSPVGNMGMPTEPVVPTPVTPNTVVNTSIEPMSQNTVVNAPTEPMVQNPVVNAQTEPMNTVVNTPNVVPTEPLNSMNLAPEGVVSPVVPEANVAQPATEPLMSATLTEQTVLTPTPVMNGTPENQMANGVSPMNGQVTPTGDSLTPPPTNNIGMMGGIPTPPAMPTDNGGKQKKSNPIVLIILIVLLIATVGFGVYYFLFMGKNKKPSVTVSAIMPEELELGTDIITDNPAAYVKVTGMNITECQVKSDLDSKKVGTYEYTVTCGSKTVGPNKVSVKDTMAPVITPKNAVVTPESVVFPDEFIDSIEDASECTYEFETDLDQIDFSVEGEHTIVVKAIDVYGNETTAEAKLIIDENAPEEYLYCESTGEASETYKDAKIFETYKYGISGNGNIYNMLKITIFNFEKEEDYRSAVENITENSFDEIEGIVKKDDKKYSISITQVVNETILSKEFNLSSFPKTSAEIEEYHMGQDEMCYMDIE